MKKLLSILAVAAFMTACNNSAETPATPAADTTTVAAPAVDTTAAAAAAAAVTAAAACWSPASCRW